MKPFTRVYLYDEAGERFFGEGPCRLLRAVEQSGSLREAAGSMNLAYSKALKMVHRAENVLGFALTETTIGGRGGGGSVLTPEAKDFLARYEQFRDTCIRENERIFRETYPEERG